MSSPEDGGELPVIDPSTPPCRHLRNKGMFVYTDGLGGESHDDYDNTLYWCNRSMKDFGPDDDYVGGVECRNPSRSCYEPL
jgi:hypothetical protein